MIINDEFAHALSVFDAILDSAARTERNTCHYQPCTCHTGTLKNNETTLNDIMDDVKQVIFNEPATIVTFSDGTKVCVKACDKDTFSKETGLIYALVTRLYANDVDENGYLRSSGLGAKISKIINGAVDQKKIAEEKKALIEEKRKQKKYNKDSEKETLNDVKKTSKVKKNKVDTNKIEKRKSK